MFMNRYKKQIPNALSVARILLTPLLFWFALRGDARGFLYWGFLLIATDTLDGILARGWRVVSFQGQRLDSRADEIFYITFCSLSVYLMAPAALAVWPLLVLPFLLLALLQPAGYFLTGKIRSLHLVSKKAISYVFIPWITISLLDEFNITMLVVINVMALLAFLEEVTIYLLARESLDESILSVFQIVRHPLDAG
jgi:phosphatidylglycerophosphate synthase